MAVLAPFSADLTLISLKKINIYSELTKLYSHLFCFLVKREIIMKGLNINMVALNSVCEIVRNIYIIKTEL